jgi:ParB/RepB/Spo0J family partition protein
VLLLISEPTVKIESRDIPLCDIHETHLLLRIVEKDSLEYMELRDSLAANGPLNSICVRPSPRIPGKFEVVDGMYRYTAFEELALTPVPCLIRHGMTDEMVLASQIEANAIRPTTKKCDFARRLKKILDDHPGMSHARLQRMVHKSHGWIGEQLGLLRLQPAIQKAVDRGEIPLMSAYVLSRVIYNQQDRFVDFAKTAPTPEFKATVSVFIKQQREAARQGKLDVLFAAEFTPIAHLRNLRDLLTEKERPQEGPTLLAVGKARTAVDGWNACLDWVMHLDAKSLDEQRRKQAERMRKHFTDRPEP